MNPFRRWLERQRVDRDLADEMAAHVEEKIEEFREQGVSEAEARIRARLQFGSLTLQREASREAWGWSGMERVVQDIRFGIRVLAANRAFTLTAVLVLALGIGMNTAMFSAVKAVLLSSLPYSRPDRLVELWQVNTEGHSMNASWPDFVDWRAQSRSFAHLATYDGDQVTFSGNFTARRIHLGVVSSGFFESLASQAAIGRTFTRREQQPGGTPTLVLSHALARSVCVPAANCLGATARIDGMAFTVIGVMPPGFDFPFAAAAWIPQEFFGSNNSRSSHNFHVVARLRDGVSLRRAQNEMNVIASRLAKTYADDRNQGIQVKSLKDELTAPIRPAFLLLSGAVILVLLIACVNISNLQLARSTARLRELALRAALGARPSRLMQQLLTESLLLSIAGGLAGFILAVFGTAALRHYAPANIPRIETIRVDGAVLAFTTLLSLASGLLFGVLPALLGTRADANEALKEGSGKTTASRQLKGWGNALILGEIALAVLLLTGAALLLKSYWKLEHVDSGLDSHGVFTADLSWPTADGNSVDAEQVGRLARALLARVNRLPGIKTAALIQPLPIRSAGSNGTFEIEGRALPADPHAFPTAFYRLATRQYFAVFGLPILRGRSFQAEDDHSSQQVAIVNELFARRFFPDGKALDQRIRFHGFDAKPQFIRIVGVIPDVHAFGLDQPAQPEVFVDYLQHAGFSLDATLLVRGSVHDEAAVRSIVTSLNRDTPVEFQNMDDIVSGTTSRERFQTVLLSIFAGFALLLSVIGIYGLLTYAVTRRTNELGIRMALGADRKTVLALVLLEGGRLIAVGLGIGLTGAFFLTHTLSSLVFSVRTNDPTSFVAVALIFGLTALLGCFVPALRASRIDPNAALRHE
ncbi:MAG TPA: ABC transporter permease [Bryobacteraceae bacterium]|nr:ABC transporter permease [Bryobacteraceae bacterium]